MKRFFVGLLTFFVLLSWVSFSNVVFADNEFAASTPTPTTTLIPGAASVLTRTPSIELTPTPAILTQSINISKPKLEAFIRVPNGIVPQPYIILSAYQSFSSTNGQVSIIGNVADKTFYCPNSPCALGLPETAQVNFYAQNQNGDKSDEIQASILVKKVGEGYSVTIITLGKFAIFSDSCANIWQNQEPVAPTWARFVQDPGELNTEKTLYYLTERLLTTGAVNAADCPGGGWDSNNSPNACGVEKAREQMVNWQNQFDLNIWLISRDEHIPPIILKTLLEVESQFWPITQRLFLDELGLGQINQLGIDVLLRTNPGLYQQVCTSSLYECNKPYESLPGIDQALIRGTLAQSLDAACPTCLYGVNLTKASQSVSLIAKVLYANCVQTKSILRYYDSTANYEDSWKFTMVSYHSGFGCLINALDKTVENSEQVNWKNVSKNLICDGATSYIDKFWGSLVNFNKYLMKQKDLTYIELQNPAPVPTRSAFFSDGRILVKIFVDQNGDGIQQAGETLDNIQVNLDLENGVSYTQVSQNGMAIFDLKGISIGVKGKISLPGLYRSAPIQIPNTGDIPIIFIFTKPVLPTQNP
jgi:hypothetical protein